MTLREILTDICLSNGWITHDETPDEELLEEALRDLPVVWKGDEDQRRWRIEYQCVCRVNVSGSLRYFKYSSCKGTNDNSWEDAGYQFEGIDNVSEVYPHEVKTIEYRHEPQGE